MYEKLKTTKNYNHTFKLNRSLHLVFKIFQTITSAFYIRFVWGWIVSNCKLINETLQNISELYLSNHLYFRILHTRFSSIINPQWIFTIFNEYSCCFPNTVNICIHKRICMKQFAISTKRHHILWRASCFLVSFCPCDVQFEVEGFLWPL